jgi:hypothetical protein
MFLCFRRETNWAQQLQTLRHATTAYFAGSLSPTKGGKYQLLEGSDHWQGSQE